MAPMRGSTATGRSSRRLKRLKRERAAGGPGRGGSTGHPAFALGEDPAQEQRVVLQLGPDVAVAQDVEQVPSGLELLLDVQAQLVLTTPATACLGRDHRAAAEPPPARLSSPEELQQWSAAADADWTFLEPVHLVWQNLGEGPHADWRRSGDPAIRPRRGPRAESASSDRRSSDRRNGR